MSSITKRWKYPKEVEFSSDLTEVCQSKVVARLLANRGIVSPVEADEFLNISEAFETSPYEFSDMEKAVDRVFKAIDNEENILIYGDFDADGITSTSILFKTFKRIGAKVSHYIPNRMTENHGLNSKAILKLISTRKIKLIITCDCGIGNHAEISLARSFNVDTIITDHHELPDELPAAYAILSTKLLESKSRMSEISGAGVAYKFSSALLSRLGAEDYIPQVKYLAAIGTIADLVPLTQENRLIAHFGLKTLMELKPPAIKEIAKNASISIDGVIKSETIAFIIAPRLNAIGRLDNASIAVELLTTEDEEVVQNLAEKLEKINKDRQKLCDEIFNQALEMLKDHDFENEYAIVLENKDWHPGIIGIVASRLVETFYRPTFLMTHQNDILKCSARGIEGIHLFNILNAHRELFNQFGGHEFAAGFSIKESNFYLIKNIINDEAKKYLNKTLLTPALDIEMQVDPDELSLELVEKINLLAPFGQNNPSPILSASNLKIHGMKTMGSNANHLRIYLRTPENQILEGIWWQKSELNINSDTSVSVAFNPEINTFANKSRMQLIIKDIQTDFAESASNSPRIKWIDLRQKSSIDKFLNSFLKLNKNNIAIFAELNSIYGYNDAKLNIISRSNLNKTYDQLIFSDYPPDINAFNEVISKINPKIIYLLPINSDYSSDENNYVKSIFGMLKYALNKLNGEANITNMSVKLSTSLDVIKAALDILCELKHIRINSYNENIIKFTIENPNLNYLSKLDKLKYHINEVKRFRKELNTKPLKEIEQMYKE